MLHIGHSAESRSVYGQGIDAAISASTFQVNSGGSSLGKQMHSSENYLCWSAPVGLAVLSMANSHL